MATAEGSVPSSYGLVPRQVIRLQEIQYLPMKYWILGSSSNSDQTAVMMDKKLLSILRCASLIRPV